MEVEDEATGGASCAPMELEGEVAEAAAMAGDGNGNGDQEPAALVDGDRRARVCLHLWKVWMLVRLVILLPQVKACLLTFCPPTH